MPVAARVTRLVTVVCAPATGIMAARPNTAERTVRQDREERSNVIQRGRMRIVVNMGAGPNRCRDPWRGSRAADLKRKRRISRQAASHFSLDSKRILHTE